MAFIEYEGGFVGRVCNPMCVSPAVETGTLSSMKVFVSLSTNIVFFTSLFRVYLPRSHEMFCILGILCIIGAGVVVVW